MRQEAASTSVSGEVRCVKCGELATGAATGWEAYLTGGFEDEPVEVVVYCPECAVREFGPHPLGVTFRSGCDDRGNLKNGHGQP